jgi:thiol-disulfide isomerase/thioredoxin
MAAFLANASGRRALFGAAGAATLTAALPARQGWAAGAAELVETEPRPLPEFGFTDAEGTPFTLEAFAGRGLLINLWATWCPPCVAEMPSLDRAQVALKPAGVVILALSSDRGGRALVEPFYQRLGLNTLGLWLDPRGAAQRALGVRGLPTSIVVDRSGQERARLQGAAEWDTPAMLDRIRRLAIPLRPATERS